MEPAKVEAAQAALLGVSLVHDLHISLMSTTEVVLAAHLVTHDGHPAGLEHEFDIHHVTLQVELSADIRCKQAPAEVV